MASLADIERHIAGLLLTAGGTYTSYTFTAERILVNYVRFSNDKDRQRDLFEQGPEAIIQPGNETWDVRGRTGLGDITILLDFGFDPNEDLIFDDIEEFLKTIRELLAYGTYLGLQFSPKTISVLKPSVDQIKTAGLIEYKIECKGYLIC